MERTAAKQNHLAMLQISTHSPRVGRTAFGYVLVANLGISTHSPRVGRTDSNDNWRPDKKAFQLTRPVWGEPFDNCVSRAL